MSIKFEINAESTASPNDRSIDTLFGFRDTWNLFQAFCSKEQNRFGIIRNKDVLDIPTLFKRTANNGGRPWRRERAFTKKEYVITSFPKVFAERRE